MSREPSLLSDAVLCNLDLVRLLCEVVRVLRYAKTSLGSHAEHIMKNLGLESTAALEALKRNDVP